MSRTVSDRVDRWQVILLASTLDDDGGIPVCVAQLAAGLQRIGVDVEVVGQSGDGLAPVLRSLTTAGRVPVTAVHHPWHPAGQTLAALALRRLIVRRAAAAAATGRRLLVHAHGVWVAPVIAALDAALAVGAAVTISPHGMLRVDALRKSRWRKTAVWAIAVRRLIARAGSLHATSAAEAAELTALFPGCHATLVPLGIEPSPLPAARDRRQGHERLAGYLGRLLPIKNLDVLLDAWAAAAPHRWRFVLAGPGDAAYVASLRRRAHDLGLGATVEFLPAVPRSAIGDFLGRLDLFVLPSRSEAFALVVGEALAAGVPVIASTAAPWEGVRSSGCGWWVAPDVSALTAALRAATGRTTAELAEMGRRGADWIRREYDWDLVARRHLAELYEPALGIGPIDPVTSSSRHFPHAAP
ncbi:MAG: glycosyltransferase [Planctomycetia bacterium]|nr:glycosyltransferase [Planctomycetia bacterium]